MVIIGNTETFEFIRPISFKYEILPSTNRRLLSFL